MCSVEKMLVKGVRSFSPYNEDAITFFKVRRSFEDHSSEEFT